MQKSALMRCCALGLALSPVAWPGSAQAETCDAPFTTDLLSHKDGVVGTVEVCNDDTNLHVTYVTDEDWCLSETRLDVDDELSAIPQTRRGAPLPRRFAYRAKHRRCVDSYAIQIALDAWVPDTELFVAANARVREESRKSKKSKHRGLPREAWGAGTPFPRGKGASYFNYTVQGETPVCGASTCVFVTSAVTPNGDLGGLTAADATCNALATAAGLPGTFVAWLSALDPLVNAKDRIPQEGPYVKTDVDNTVIAEDLAELTSGALQSPIDHDEFGNGVAPANVWTGTFVDGTGDGIGTCDDWTSSDAGTGGQWGVSSSVTGTWTSQRPSRALCLNPGFRLYCFGR